MGTEKFNYVKPSVAHGQHIQLQSQAWGDPVTEKSRAEAAGTSNIRPAGLFSTAPYKGPKEATPSELAKDETGKFTKLCPGPNDEGCNAYATKKTGYCVGHSRKLGLI
jgi:hypothetical protein